MFIFTPLVKTDKGCFMFTVQPICKFIILSSVLVFLLLINITANDIVLLIISIVFLVWVCRYVFSLKIIILNQCIVKETGNTFKRKNIIMLKSISNIQILTVHAVLPAYIRLNSYNQSLYIVGLNGRQRRLFEKHILRLK